MVKNNASAFTVEASQCGHLHEKFAYKFRGLLQQLEYISLMLIVDL